MQIEHRYIAEDGIVFDLYSDCRRHEQVLEERRKKLHDIKVRKASDRFLRSVGFYPNCYKTVWKKNRALNRTWIVFDKFGQIKGLKTCDSRNYPENGCDFCYETGEDKSDMTVLAHWLQKNHLYAHLLSSFVEHSYLDFYEWDMLQKLENLCWDVKNGKIA